MTQLQGDPFRFYSVGVLRLLSLALSGILRTSSRNVMILQPAAPLSRPPQGIHHHQEKMGHYLQVCWGSIESNRFSFLEDVQMSSIC